MSTIIDREVDHAKDGEGALPGYPGHIVQRGHNRQAVFPEPADYRYSLDALAEFKNVYGMTVYAWCLMTNHVHLLVAPGEEVAVVRRLMKRLAGPQTRYHNRLEGCSGTLWESRYRSSPVDTDTYLLAFVRYIESNPTRGHLVATPGAYPWSSCRYRSGRHWHACLDENRCCRALGANATERVVRYRRFLRSVIPEAEWTLLRDAL